MRGIWWLVVSMLVARAAFADGADLPRPQTWDALTPFRNQAEFDAYRRRAREIAKAHGAWWASMRTQWRGGPLLAQMPPPCDPAVQDCSQELVDVRVFSLHGCATRSVEHDQVPGVDEGDLVKTFDRFIVVLRHGRLYSLDTGTAPGRLKLVDRVDAYAAGDLPAVIDELAIYGDTLLVASHGFEPDSSNFALFRISREGRIEPLARYFVESDENYDWERFTTRIADGKLVFHAFIGLGAYGAGEEVALPRIRGWTPRGGYSEWRPLLRVTDVYRPVQPVLSPSLYVLSACAIDAGAAPRCRARGIIGPDAPEVYVSNENAYLWLTTRRDDLQSMGEYSHGYCAKGVDTFPMRSQSSTAYRMSLASGKLTAAHSEGLLPDRFALHEQAGSLWALVSRPPIECEWNGEVPDDEALALVKIPSDAFSNTPGSVRGANLLRVPDVQSHGSSVRFTGEYLLFGQGQGAERAVWHDAYGEAYRRSNLAVVPLSSPGHATVLELPHSVERIEPFGSNALVFGYQPDDEFAVSSVVLGKQSHHAGTQAVPGVIESVGIEPAYDGLTKSDGSGVFGIPTVNTAALLAGKDDEEIPTGVHFFTADAEFDLRSADGLEAGVQDPHAHGYACEVSCYDWYGNSRPIVFRDRLFALMGQHVVEGTLINGRVTEVARVDLSIVPAGVQAASCASAASRSVCDRTP